MRRICSMLVLATLGLPAAAGMSFPPTKTKKTIPIAAEADGPMQGMKLELPQARGPINRPMPACITVGVRQAPTQDDPTASPTVEFEVFFSEPIYAPSFTPSDIVQNGTSIVAAWVISDPEGDNQFFNLTATGAGPGTVIPSIPPGAAGTAGTCSAASANPGTPCGSVAECPDGSGTGSCDGSSPNASSVAVDSSVTVGPVGCATLTYLYAGVWSPPRLYVYCVEADGTISPDGFVVQTGDVRDLAAGSGGGHLYYASDNLTKYFVSTDGSLLLAGSNPVGQGTFDDLAFDPSVRYLYGSHSRNGGRVYVYDTQTTGNLPTQIQFVTGLVSPHGVAATPDGSQLYVANQWDFLGSAPNQEEIVIFNRNANGTLSFSGASTWSPSPDYIAVHPTLPRIYHTDRPGGRVNTSSVVGSGLAEAPGKFSGWGASQLVLNAAGTRLYVTNYNDNTVSVFQVSSGDLTFLEAVPTAARPQHVVLHPGGTHLYVACAGDVSGASTIDVFAIEPDGTLAPVQAEGIADQGAYRMVIVSFD